MLQNEGMHEGLVWSSGFFRSDFGSMTSARVFRVDAVSAVLSRWGLLSCCARWR